MNAYEQLGVIRERLEQQGAHEDTIAMIDRLIARAASERESHMSVTQVAMVRHMLRQREAIDNTSIYDDLQDLIHEIERAPAEARPAWEDTERRPKPRSYYRQIKEKAKDKGKH
jgi:hypothetical protein